MEELEGTLIGRNGVAGRRLDLDIVAGRRLDSDVVDGRGLDPDVVDGRIGSDINWKGRC